MKKTDRFKLNVSGYEKVIANLTDENDDYSMKKSELLDEYETDDRIYKFTNTDLHPSVVPDESDPKTLRVIALGEIVGLVNSGSVSHVKNLLKSPKFSGMYVDLYGGSYKHRTYDDDVVSISDTVYYADLFIFTTVDDPVPEPSATIFQTSPVPPAAPEKKKGGAASIALIVFGVLFLIGGVGNFPTDIFTGFVGLLIGGVCLYFGIMKRHNLKQ